MPETEPYRMSDRRSSVQLKRPPREMGTAPCRELVPMAPPPRQPLAQQEPLWLRFGRGGQTPQLSGHAEEYGHVRETIKGPDYFLKRGNVSKARDTMHSFIRESNVTEDTAARQCRSLFTVKSVKWGTQRHHQDKHGTGAHKGRRHPQRIRQPE